MTKSLSRFVRRDRRSSSSAKQHMHSRRVPFIDILAFIFTLAEICYVSLRSAEKTPCLEQQQPKLDVEPCDDNLLVAQSSSTPLNTVPSRAYPPKSLSCEAQPEGNLKRIQNTPLSQETSNNKGLMYFNLVHSNDDVVGSVALNMAPSTCPVRMGTTRQTAHGMNYRDRNSEESFLFTFVRSPTERVIRDFFHHMVTIRKWEPSDSTFQAYLKERGYYRNRNLQELALEEEYDPTNASAVVESIVHGYDFIGVSERRDESLVVLKLLLGLKTSQILYLLDPTPFVLEEERCNLITKPFLSPNMRFYFESPAWQAQISGGDGLLYQAANRSLDQTINRLGRTVVEEELRHFRWSLEHARQVCEPKVIFPCNMNGMWQRGRHTCAFNSGYGCAKQCLARKELVAKVDQQGKDDKIISKPIRQASVRVP